MTFGETFPGYITENFLFRFSFILTLQLTFLIGPNKCCKNLADGEYQDSRFCHRFVTCIRGQASAQICPGGLVFDPSKRECLDTAQCLSKMAMDVLLTRLDRYYRCYIRLFFKLIELELLIIWFLLIMIAKR